MSGVPRARDGPPVTDRLLIRGGDVIDTELEPVVRRATDVLIEDGRIAEVGSGLTADGAEVIDATDRIVLPGFVDAHRHVWQAGLRSMREDGERLVTEGITSPEEVMRVTRE